MRLLNADTLEFKFFSDGDLPEYVILSHTWGPEEVNYQEMCWLQRVKGVSPEIKANPLFPLLLGFAIGSNSSDTDETLLARKGYEKIVKTAEITRQRGYDYFWIDTCCIDKASSSELQEAINSMYNWYRNAAICLVYLEDILWESPRLETRDTEDDKIEKQFENALSRSRWTKRGWTLQELIAPRVVHFFDTVWTYIGLKQNFLSPLSRVTWIPIDVLGTGDLSRASIAQKMSWASCRNTTRVEDLAYCLLGLFGIHMPMLYGEGSAAFIRLQNEIMKELTDDSLFAWKAEQGDNFTYRGLLARSPREFASSSGISAGSACKASYTSSGIRLETLRVKYGKPTLYMAMLNAFDNGAFIILFLEEVGSGQQYARIHVANIWTSNTTSWNQATSKEWGTMYIRQSPLISSSVIKSMIYCFQFRRGSRQPATSAYSIRAAWPSGHWLEKGHQIIVRNYDDVFVGMVRLEQAQRNGLVTDTMDSATDHRCKQCRHRDFYLILRFDKKSKEFWCSTKFCADANKKSRTVDDEETWTAVRKVSSKERKIGGSIIVIVTPDDLGKCPQHPSNSMIVSMDVGLVGDRLALFVDIDGLAV